MTKLCSTKRAAGSVFYPRERRIGSYVMAPLSDPVECGTDISIVRCRELLGDAADSMTDHEIAMIRHHALAMAHVIVEMYEEHRKDSE